MKNQGKQTVGDDALADRLVGLPAICAVIGVCVPTGRKLARDPACGLPLRMVGGRWWASRRALVAWVAAQTSAGR